MPEDRRSMKKKIQRIIDILVIVVIAFLLFCAVYALLSPPINKGFPDQLQTEKLTGVDLPVSQMNSEFRVNAVTLGGSFKNGNNPTNDQEAINFKRAPAIVARA
jgi:hypothetical protein